MAEKILNAEHEYALVGEGEGLGGLTIFVIATVSVVGASLLF